VCEIFTRDAALSCQRIPVPACRANCDELDAEAYSSNKGWRIKGEVFWDL